MQELSSRNSPRNLDRFSARSASCTTALNDLFSSRAMASTSAARSAGKEIAFLTALLTTTSNSVVKTTTGAARQCVRRDSRVSFVRPGAALSCSALPVQKT